MYEPPFDNISTPTTHLWFRAPRVRILEHDFPGSISSPFANKNAHAARPPIAYSRARIQQPESTDPLPGGCSRDSRGGRVQISRHAWARICPCRRELSEADEGCTGARARRRGRTPRSAGVFAERQRTDARLHDNYNDGSGHALDG
jgi:hypothetical protein